MSKLILRELNANDEAVFMAGWKDWEGEDPVWYSFAWKKGMSHSEHLQILENDKDKSKVPANRVASSMLYAFVDGQIVGRLNIRHELNDHLLQRGGHVGYAVSPRHRRKGYASEIYRLGLDYCRTLGLDRILVTCADSNEPSWRIIEKFQGVLENKIWDDAKNEYVRRYWVQL